MIVDLFSGVGGFTLGALDSGIPVALSADFDPDLTSSHCHNFPGVPLLLRDLREVDVRQLLVEVNLSVDDVTGVVGGPPCQGFSDIGRRDVLDPRNSLVARFFDLVADIYPPFFIFENVPGILNKRFRNVLDHSLDPLANHYTILGPLLLDASAFGVPTERTRVVVVGVAQPSEPLSADGISTGAAPSTVADALAGLPGPVEPTNGRADYGWRRVAPDHDLGAYARRMRRPPPDCCAPVIRQAHEQHRVSGFQVTRHSQVVIDRFSVVPPGSRDPVSKFPRLHPGRPAPTLRAGTGRDRGSYQSMRPIHPSAPRVITIREAARLQGFPDWFLFHPTKWHSFRMIGNSIVPAVASAVLEFCRSRV